jgi:D-glycero-D-manno-heptose 1,7-bisphosphate phosphatase
MLLQAARDYDVDLSRSFMVGDKLADIEAGKRAGCQSILVLTGYGQKTVLKPEVSEVDMCSDLGCAAELINASLTGMGVAENEFRK